MAVHEALRLAHRLHVVVMTDARVARQAGGGRLPAAVHRDDVEVDIDQQVGLGRPLVHRHLLVVAGEAEFDHAVGVFGVVVVERIVGSEGVVDPVAEGVAQFGLGQMTSSGFPGESAGMLSHYSNWRPISQATIAYGYGVSVTPLQLAQAYSALGNGGMMQAVSLFANDEPSSGERIVSAETANAVRRMLEEVVRPGGTGTKASVDGYRVAGKTGTSWKFAKGGYSEDKYISIFAGLAPASNPRLATVVVIDEPGGELYYGSDVAAPVFADVMAESLRLLAVPPDAMPARDPGSVVQAMADRNVGP